MLPARTTAHDLYVPGIRGEGYRACFDLGPSLSGSSEVVRKPLERRGKTLRAENSHGFAASRKRLSNDIGRTYVYIQCEYKRRA